MLYKAKHGLRLPRLKLSKTKRGRTWDGRWYRRARWTESLGKQTRKWGARCRSLSSRRSPSVALSLWNFKALAPSPPLFDFRALRLHANSSACNLCSCFRRIFPSFGIHLQSFGSLDPFFSGSQARFRCVGDFHSVFSALPLGFTRLRDSDTLLGAHFVA